MFSHKHICLWAELLARAAKEEPDPPCGWSRSFVHTAQGAAACLVECRQRKLAGLQSAFSEKLHPSPSAPSTHTQTKKIRRTTGHPSIQSDERLGPYRQTNQEGRTPNNNNNACSFGLTGWPSRELAEMLKENYKVWLRACPCVHVHTRACTNTHCN